MKEFDIHNQYAGFYQSATKKDFLSSKLFIFICAFTFTGSLVSIPYLSNTEGKASHSQRVTSNFLAPMLTPVVGQKIARSDPLPTSQVKTTTDKALSSEKKTDASKPLLTMKATQPIGSKTQPPIALPIASKTQKAPETKKTEEQKSATPTPHLTVVDFKIKKGLVKDSKQIGFPRSLTNELTHAFSEKLDIRKIRPGDRFTVLYHKHQKDKKSHEGRILAATYTSKRNKIIKVVRLKNGIHKSAFFSLDRLHDAFSPTKSLVSILRKPVKSGRVSSPFQPRRFHPILKKYRPHLGVDYAAAPGSPIIASGNGKVTFVGYQQGYGNLVIIKHDKQYSTRYGHLAKFAKIKQGSVVKQGQVIGFVGKTGHATGHHVHYEIRINGKPQNPLTVALPNVRKTTPAIPAKRRQEIAHKAKFLFEKMDELRGRHHLR